MYTPTFKYRLGKEYKLRFLSNFTHNQERSRRRKRFGRLEKAPEKLWRVEFLNSCPAQTGENWKRCLAGKTGSIW